MTPLSVAMALYSDLPFDSRVLREARTLAEAGHRVTVYCLEGDRPPGAPFDVITRPGEGARPPNPFQGGSRSSRLSRVADRARWATAYVRDVRAWGRWAAETAGLADVWHAHDLPGLMAVAPQLRPGQKLVYDSHEIFIDAGTASFLPGPLRWLLQRYERRLTGRAAALITVNEAVGEVLAERLHPKRIVITRNCPPRWQAPRGAVSPLRAAAGIPPSAPIILYHGSLGSDRGIEAMAQALLEEGLASVHAVALGFGELDRWLALAADPRLGGRFHVLDAVPPDELLRWVSGADLDIIVLKDTSLNHRLSTPNKLWESLAAGVPVVVSDFPAMRRVVVEDPAGPLGALCDPEDVRSVAEAITRLISLSAAESAELRKRCRSVAAERWNWETESVAMLKLYEELGAVQSEPG